MLDYREFISNRKSMLIAPAGFGKTYTITECLKHSNQDGKQLILTHTHAGVASIKEKIKKAGIPGSKYTIETISSFAQKYVLAFYNGKDIPEQDDSKKYYPFIIKNAIIIIKKRHIQHIISNSYIGLFVDEYQDCTKKQHELILLLSELLPTRILGDFLQGIFGFGGESLVDLESTEEMGEFQKHYYELNRPQRWLNGNNDKLGDDLKKIRELLLEKKAINTELFPSIETYLTNDIYKDNYRFIIDLITEEKSILIIDPISTNIHSRISFIQRFKNIPRLIESIDQKEFYNLSKDADLISTENLMDRLVLIANQIFNKTGVGNWITTKGVRRKKNESDQILSELIIEKIRQLERKISFSLLSELLVCINDLPDIKCYRKELFNSLCSALIEAEFSNITVIEAMKKNRNLIRRSGRKIYGKCIGTTLLTKGLEFDTVLIINAHKFDCPKHLYVALTRASKRLVLFSESKILNPF